MSFKNANDVRLILRGGSDEYVYLLAPEEVKGMSILEAPPAGEERGNCVDLGERGSQAISAYPIRGGLLSEAWSSVWSRDPSGSLTIPAGRYQVRVTYAASQSARARVWQCTTNAFELREGSAFVSTGSGAKQWR
jgi:hypothetical protein